LKKKLNLTVLYAAKQNNFARAILFQLLSFAGLKKHQRLDI